MQRWGRKGVSNRRRRDRPRFARFWGLGPDKRWALGSNQATAGELQSERLDMFARLTATLSHELRNPLGVIRSSVFYVQRKLGGEVDERISKHLDRIEQQVVVCDSIIEALVEYSRGRRSQPLVGSLNEWLQETVGKYGVPTEIAVKLSLADRLPDVAFDPEKFGKAVGHLIANAVHALEAREAQPGPGPNVERVLEVTTRHAGDRIALVVRDNGIGMEEATRSRALEPLFTTRARGTGMGLAVVDKIVREHGGEIVLASEAGTGTMATVYLPLVSRDGDAARAVPIGGAK